MTNKPTMKQVTSSMVDAVGYDDVYNVLYVEYKGGKTYTYDGVPPHVWEALEKADSVGAFINADIKKGPYTCTKLDA